MIAESEVYYKDKLIAKSLGTYFVKIKRKIRINLYKYFKPEVSIMLLDLSPYAFKLGPIVVRGMAYLWPSRF